MGQIKVRPATESDALTLAKLRYEFRSLFHQVREDEATFVERCTVWMRERLRSESLWKCWIAESQDTAVGDVWVQLVEKIPNPIEEPEYYIYLTNFYVREQYRNHGIGSMLLSEILDWARSTNVKTVILQPTERSKAFYTRHGFATAEDFMHLKLK
jgi:GNAT superfamily N-acetyltransferase